MRDTVHCVVDDCDPQRVAASIHAIVDSVAAYVPGYRLKQEPQFRVLASDDPLTALGLGGRLLVSVYLEVEGAAHHLPAYAGNLDIMTSAALRTAERLAERNRAR